jgi:hypothetical protein
MISWTDLPYPRLREKERVCSHPLLEPQHCPQASRTQSQEEPAPPTTQLTPGPSHQRSECQLKPRYIEGSVYGKKSQAQVDKMSTRNWRKVVGELSSTPRKGKTAGVYQKSKATRDVPIPFPTRKPLTVNLPVTESGKLEGEVEEELLHTNDEETLTLNMYWEGGTQAINFLLAKAVSPTAQAPIQKSPKEWSYHDLAHLNPQELELWRTACNEELDTLKKQNIFELVDRPTDRKTIKNRWVFNIKSDRSKRPA